MVSLSQMPNPPEVTALLAWNRQAISDAPLDPLGVEIGRLDIYAEVWRIYQELGEEIPKEVEEELLYGKSKTV